MSDGVGLFEQLRRRVLGEPSQGGASAETPGQPAVAAAPPPPPPPPPPPAPAAPVGWPPAGPIPGEAIMNTPEIAAKVAAYEAKAPHYVILRSRSSEPGFDGLPVPPSTLWEGYGANATDYLTQGRVHTMVMRGLMAESGFPLEQCHRILDLGCAGGRMIRFLNDLSGQAEIWGVDIGEAHIHWCQQHLSPPFKFVSTSTFPHLPFEDNSFDFIYAGSVFTHIAELADSWVLELRRILRPGGRMFLTVHDRHTVELLYKLVPTGWFTDLVRSFERQTKFLDQDFAVATISRSPYAQVFYDIDYLKARWGRFLTVVAVHPEGYGIQTAVQLQK